jgi:hypothetical protein
MLRMRTREWVPCIAAEVELDSAGFKHSWRTLIKAFYSNVRMLNGECLGDSAYIIFYSCLPAGATALGEFWPPLQPVST